MWVNLKTFPSSVPHHFDVLWGLSTNTCSQPPWNRFIMISVCKGEDNRVIVQVQLIAFDIGTSF